MELNAPVDFPLSIDTQSEVISSHNFFDEGHITGNSKLFEEGPKESEMPYNNFFEDALGSTDVEANCIFEGQPTAADKTLNDNLFDEEHRGTDIVANSTIIEHGPRICPLCCGLLGSYFMNFSEKILMCENLQCEFPFGHEDLQIIQVDTGIEFHQDMLTLNSNSTRSKIPQSSPTCSVISTSVWSEINKRNHDIESSQFDSKSLATTASEREEKLKKQIEAKEIQNRTFQNLNDIKLINRALRDYRDSPKTYIRNRKWLHNMKSLEEMSGVKLLMKKEKAKLKDKQSHQGKGEFKIDIDTANDDMSSIKIQITNAYKANDLI